MNEKNEMNESLLKNKKINNCKVIKHWIIFCIPPRNIAYVHKNLESFLGEEFARECLLNDLKIFERKQKKHWKVKKHWIIVCMALRELESFASKCKVS